ncbi:MAG: Ig-like domain-containing protein [Bacteroides sp.]
MKRIFLGLLALTLACLFMAKVKAQPIVKGIYFAETIDVIKEGANLNQKLIDEKILKEGEVFYDAATNTLTLVNAYMEFPSKKPGIWNKEFNKPLTIKLIGISQIVVKEQNGIFNGGTTNIVGDKLFIDVQGSSSDYAGILNARTLKIGACHLYVDGGVSAGISGVLNGDNFVFESAYVKTKGQAGSLLGLAYNEFKKCSITQPVGAKIDSQKFNVVDADGNLIKKEVVITPEGGVKPFLTVYPSALEFEIEGTTKSIQVACEQAWDLDPEWKNPYWLSIKIKGGSAETVKTVDITVETNKTTERTATLKFTTKGLTAELVVKQKGKGEIPVTGVKLSEKTVTLKKETSITLVATVLPQNATHQGVKWESDNPNIATVTNGEVKGVGEGDTKIRVITEEGNFKAECSVHVTRDDVPLQELTLPAELHVKVNETKMLNVGYKPIGVTNKGVEWKSANEKIATVENGSVKGIAVGETTVVVTSVVDKTKSASCKVVVARASAVDDAEFADVRIAPNPFDSYLNFYSFEPVQYRLLNVQGLLMAGGNIASAAEQIATESLPRGIYFLQLIKANGARKVYKVVKR